MSIEFYALFAPVVLVIALALLNRFFKGWKTNALGVTVAVLGGLQTMDLSFLPSTLSAPLLTGSGIAVLIVSQLTERAK